MREQTSQNAQKTRENPTGKFGNESARDYMQNSRGGEVSGPSKFP